MEIIACLEDREKFRGNSIIYILVVRKKTNYRIRKPNITGEKGIVDDVVIAGEKDYF